MLLLVTVFIVILAVGYKWLYRYTYQYTSANTRNFSDSKLSDIHELFLKTVFTLLGYVAKCDGAVNAQEIQRIEIFMKKMGLDLKHKRAAIRLFKVGAEPKFNAQNTINNFKSLANKSPNLTKTLLGYLINLARVDGLLVNEEVDAVQKVALGLGYSTTTFNELLNKGAPQPNKENTVRNQDSRSKAHSNKTNTLNTTNSSLAAAYDIFEMQASASNTEIKKAYRILANQYHPDKIIGQSLQANRTKASSENFKTIQAAYEDIKKSRE
jgi:DnaJ like chaperone protein